MLSEEIEFEWDSRKNESNREKHGLDFMTAAQIFFGDYIVSPARTVNGEERFFAIGKLEDIYVTVVFTKREPNVRLISARRARDAERKKYHQNFCE